jgi:hypothetical protein
MTHRFGRRAVRRGPLFLCVAASAALAAGGPDAKRTSHTVFVDRGLVEPTVLHVDSDDVIGFSNDSDATAQIVFDADVADKVRCLDVPPSFYRDGTGDLVSRPIGSLEFPLPCPLPSGEYRYRVRFSYGVGGVFESLVPADDAEPETSVAGEIQVE